MGTARNTDAQVKTQGLNGQEVKMELDAPNIGELERSYINRTIDGGFVSTFGPFVGEFESKFAEYLKIKGAVSTQSGTAALHIALYELGIGKGDEVIIPCLTFVATANPILYVGAKAVVVDVDVRTWNISADQIESKITKKTKAVIPVHFYGNPCNMDAMMDIARRHNLYIVEDTTESLGATYKSRLTGTFGDLGCFSFNGNKVITTGGGGMVVGRDVERLNHIKFLVNQARSESKSYYHPEIGFNYRMTNIEAALGLAQMERLEEFLDKKRRYNAIYRSELGGINSIRFQEGYPDTESSYWFTSILIENGIDIARLQIELKGKAIPTRRVFMPIVEFPPYKSYKNTEYRNSYYIYDRSLCLPSSTLNSEDDIYYVCEVLKGLLAQ